MKSKRILNSWIWFFSTLNELIFLKWRCSNELKINMWTLTLVREEKKSVPKQFSVNLCEELLFVFQNKKKYKRNDEFFGSSTCIADSKSPWVESTIANEQEQEHSLKKQKQNLKYIWQQEAWSPSTIGCKETQHTRDSLLLESPALWMEVAEWSKEHNVLSEWFFFLWSCRN